MLKTLGAVFAAALLALALAAGVGASPVAGASKAKPGFTPGGWSGNGVIDGKTVDAVATTTFKGSVSFGLDVEQGGDVSGSGRLTMTMRGHGDAGDSVLKGTANLTFGGTATNVTFSGTQTVKGIMRQGRVSAPIQFTRQLRGTLTISRAGHCKVVGRSTGKEAAFKWTAKLKGAGTCRT